MDKYRILFNGVGGYSETYTDFNKYLRRLVNYNYACLYKPVAVFKNGKFLNLKPEEWVKPLVKTTEGTPS